MVIKFVSIVEYRAPAYSEKYDYKQRDILLGKHRDGHGFFFEPFLLGEKKVIHIEELPHPMRNRKEVKQWLKTKGKHLLSMISPMMENY